MLNVSPLIFAGLIPIEKVPSSPAVPLPSVFPRLSLITTVLPASVVPVSLSPTSLTARPSSTGGCVSISMVKATDCPLVPRSLVAVAVKTWSPSASASEGVKLHLPSASATMGGKLGTGKPLSLIDIVLPGSAVPLRVGRLSSVASPFFNSPVTAPASSVTVRIVGWAGYCESEAVNSVAGPMLPTAS
ncbi:Uncharacterised protein [Salmonella enterica subsp. enterica serovar Typhi]|nr:Uncharacterised protein [Salmonella enterica subsp. enterica serovar Typhi]CFZ57028.1 Uncharacterised protein [Salmonella enterica subsp. enterica serovar Typhi]CGX43961.1 Uncharacterised protein [Salmonella enterica subsp. enterica serovar Typhi]CGZ08205.1 Uncharacterised protein [Salmonella enterica subsp. enterica serovar Typhi]CGZ27805.1 Uncharacterised protein [Salmonella enterica subsp. enterica serovar Typhi]